MKINEGIGNTLRTKIVTNVFGAEFHTLEKQSIGDTISKVINDVGSFKTFFTGIFCQIIFDSITLIVVAVILIAYDPLLASLVVLTIPIALLVGNKSKVRINALSVQVRESLSKLTSVLQRWLSKATYVKLYSIEGHASRYFEIENTRIKDRVVALGKKQAVLSGLNGFLFNVPNIVILGYGGLQVLNGRLEVGYLFAFMAYTGYFLGPIGRLSNFLLIDLPSINPVIVRIMDALKPAFDSGKTHAVALGLTDMARIHVGKIVFPLTSGRLEFGPATIGPNEIVGIVGPNGAGKSVLGKLLGGFYTPEEGAIFLEGDRALADSTFVLTQKPVLFEASVIENITLFDEKTDLDKVSRILQDLQLLSWCVNLEDGLNTNLDEAKQGLISGGERQKLNLARLLYTKRRILVLDEPEVYLDHNSRQLLASLLTQYCSNKTIIIVSHSQELLLSATRIIHCDLDHQMVIK